VNEREITWSKRLKVVVVLFCVATTRRQATVLLLIFWMGDFLTFLRIMSLDFTINLWVRVTSQQCPSKLRKGPMVQFKMRCFAGVSYKTSMVITPNSTHLFPSPAAARASLGGKGRGGIEKRGHTFSKFRSFSWLERGRRAAIDLQIHQRKREGSKAARQGRRFI
jgi:hypothetical protein